MFPELAEWLGSRPFVALDHATEWPKILSILRWFRDNPNSNLYLRQLDIPDIDTKFIETRKPLLNELLEALLDNNGGGLAAQGIRTFEQRYGLRGKPSTIQFRILDRRLSIGGLSDIAVPDADFASLMLPAPQIFITEMRSMGWHFLTFPTASWSSGLATHWTDWQRRLGWQIALFIIGVILTLMGSQCSIGSAHIFRAPVHC